MKVTKKVNANQCPRRLRAAAAALAALAAALAAAAAAAVKRELKLIKLKSCHMHSFYAMPNRVDFIIYFLIL